MRHVRTSHGLLGIVCDAKVRIKPLVGRRITHTTYNGAAHFVKECASKHSSSGCSLFAYFNPYTDSILVEKTYPTTIPPRTNWFWSLREHFITVDYPLLFRLGDNLPTTIAYSLVPHYPVLVNSLYYTCTHMRAPHHTRISVGMITRRLPSFNGPSSPSHYPVRIAYLPS